MFTQASFSVTFLTGISAFIWTVNGKGFCRQAACFTRHPAPFIFLPAVPAQPSQREFSPLHSVKRERRLQDSMIGKRVLQTVEAQRPGLDIPIPKAMKNSGTSVLLSRFRRSVRWR